MSVLKLVFKWLFKLILLLLGVALLYLLVAWVCSFIPSNAQAERLAKGNRIFLKSNGVHLDFMLPLRNELYDWSSVIDVTAYEAGEQAKWVALGWGDKGFFMETPTWAELKPSVAVEAMLLPSETAMHVSLHAQTPRVGENTREVYLTDQQYQQLVEFIDATFERSDTGAYLRIDHEGYPGLDDHFYEAEGSYYFWQTCNNWANEGIKKIGLKTAVWAPFDWGILKYFPQ